MTRFFSNQTVSRSIIVFCFLLFFSLNYAQSDNFERQINIPDYSGSAKILLDTISAAENIVFAYSSEVSLSYEVKFQKKQMLLNEFLELLFKDKPIGYKVNGNKVFMYIYLLNVGHLAKI